jgi:hypothetical protein
MQMIFFEALIVLGYQRRLDVRRMGIRKLIYRNRGAAKQGKNAPLPQSS